MLQLLELLHGPDAKRDFPTVVATPADVVDVITAIPTWTLDGENSKRFGHDVYRSAAQYPNVLLLRVKKGAESTPTLKGLYENLNRRREAGVYVCGSGVSLCAPRLTTRHPRSRPPQLSAAR